MKIFEFLRSNAYSSGSYVAVKEFERKYIPRHQDFPLNLVSIEWISINKGPCAYGNLNRVACVLHTCICVNICF